MHTYFTMASITMDQLQAALDQGANHASDALNSALDRTYLRRITQPNGIPLLFAGTLVLLWILWTLIVLPVMNSKVSQSGVSHVIIIHSLMISSHHPVTSLVANRMTLQSAGGCSCHRVFQERMFKVLLLPLQQPMLPTLMDQATVHVLQSRG